MIWEIGSGLKHLFLPPYVFGWLLVLAWLLARKSPRGARWALALALIGGYVCGTPWFSSRLTHFVLDHKAASPATAPQAIVILGGGRTVTYDARDRAIEAYPSAAGLERVATGARLQRTTRLPILVTGGASPAEGFPEAEVMRDALVRDFNVPVRWVEGAARNTVENARLSASMLRAAGVTSIYLVTSDYHLRRGRVLFEDQGLSVIPVAAQRPTGSDGQLVETGYGPPSWRDFVPNAFSLTDTYMASNELAGMLYARLNMR